MQSARYKRHEPEKTLLYRLVQEHLRTFLEFAQGRDRSGREAVLEDATGEIALEGAAARARSSRSAERRGASAPRARRGGCRTPQDGFSLHAGVRIRKGDREGLELLARYVLRPPFSAERLELLPDGRVRYELRRPRPDGSTHLVLSPLELLEKLAALVPPPRAHLVVYHGILGPRCRARRRVVPDPPSEASPCEDPGRHGKGRSRRDQGSDREAPRSREAPTGPGRTPWATLLRRTFGLDVLACPECGGRMEVIATITEPEAIRRILRCLGHPEDPPRAAPARPPSDPGLEFDQAG